MRQCRRKKKGIVTVMESAPTYLCRRARGEALELGLKRVYLGRLCADHVAQRADQHGRLCAGP